MPSTPNPLQRLEPPSVLAADSIEATAAELAAMDSETLRRELAEGLRLTARHLLRLALIVRTLEERGEDLSDLRIGLLGHLRRIAHGQILPEIVVRYAESPALLRRIETLPMPDQRRLAKGEGVQLAVRAPDGSITHRLVDPLHLSYDQVRLVFGPRGIRDEAEQAIMLDRQRPKPSSRTHKVGRITADPERQVLKIGRTAVPVADVVQALAALRGGDPEEESDTLESLVNVRLTESEHLHIKRLALDGNTSMNSLIRRALIAAGLIGPKTM